MKVCKSQLCSGISNSNGRSCDLCFHHKDQIDGKNKLTVTETENNSNRNQSQINYCNGTTAAGNPCKMRVKYSISTFVITMKVKILAN